MFIQPAVDLLPVLPSVSMVAHQAQQSQPRFQAKLGGPNTVFSRFYSQPDPERMKADVGFLVKLLRNPEHMDDLNRAADYIRLQWEALNLPVEEQRFTVNGKTFRNLMVSLGPRDAERLVIGAHYDVYRDQPGADDNASGVAGLLELTRLLAEKKIRLNKRLDLAAYTLEEGPYFTLGSKHHVEKLKAEKAPVKGMISLEMIGYYDDAPNSQRLPNKVFKLFYPSKGDFIALVGYGRSLGFISRTQKAFNRFSNIPAKKLYVPFNAFGVDRSDHNYFAKAGVPALMVTDTAEYRNANYHRPGDTMETLDFGRMTEVVKAIYGLVARDLSV